MWLIASSLLLFSVTAFCNKKYMNMAVVSFVIFILFYCFRGELATDWQTYKLYFDSIQDSNIVTKAGFEIGFYWLNNVFNMFNVSYWILVFAISLFASIMFYLSIKPLTRNLGIAMLLGLYYYFYPSLECARQIITLALFYLSLQYIDDKPKKYLLFNVLGVLFHRTGIITLLYLVFHRYKLAKIGICCSSIFFMLLKPYIVTVLQYFPMLLVKYNWYCIHHGLTNTFITQLCSFKAVEYILLMTVFILLKEKNNLEKNTLDLLELGLVLQLFIGRFLEATYRLVYYTDLGVILAYCYLYDRIKKPWQKVVYVVAIVMYVGLRFYRVVTLNKGLFSI